MTEPTTNPCRSCGQEIDADPGERCDACEHRARTERGEFVVKLDGRLLCPTRPDDPARPAYVFTTVHEAERIAAICYPGLSSRVAVEPAALRRAGPRLPADEVPRCVQTAGKRLGRYP